MRNRVIERAYESIREYVPEDAKTILNEQVPKIEKFIDEEMEKFGGELAAYVVTEIDSLVKKTMEEAESAKQEVSSVILKIEADIAAGDETLTATVNELKTSLDKYEERFSKLGAGVRQAATKALQSAGLPVSGFL